MNNHLLSFAALLLLPGLASALDYNDLTERYDDAPFSRAETAGISVLTEVGAVEGNPDGTFAPARSLNRAEFVKIALLAGGVRTGESVTCFPDVKEDQWFSVYVCSAKNNGIVAGNPDGLFHPERAVNYAEALKILAEIFDYELPVAKVSEPWPWYMPYMLAAQDRGVALPGSVTADTLLTRGQMARLAAAFVAEDEGELDEYRAFERGQEVSSSSSSSSVSSQTSSVSSVSSSSVSSSSSSRSSSSAVSLFPTRARFLVAGMTSPSIGDGVFSFPDQDARITSVEVELRREVNGLAGLELITSAGEVIATLDFQTYSNVSRTKWRADSLSGSFVLPKDEAVRLGLRARMKTVAEGAASNESLEIKTFTVYAAGVTTNDSRQLVPDDINYYAHQTTLGRITGIRNDLAMSMTVPQGTSRTIGTFTVSGMSANGSMVGMKNLSFLLQASNVNVSTLMIGGPTGDRGQCGVENQDGQRLVTCFVPEHMQTVAVSPVTLSVYADLALAGSASVGTVQLLSFNKGGMSAAGSMLWTDGSATFNWIETDVGLDDGPGISVTK